MSNTVNYTGSFTPHHQISTTMHKKKEANLLIYNKLASNKSGLDGTRTRDPLRDRQVF